MTLPNYNHEREWVLVSTMNELTLLCHDRLGEEEKGAVPGDDGINIPSKGSDCCPSIGHRLTLFMVIPAESSVVCERYRGEDDETE